MIGFGKSDKLAHQSDITYAGHVRWITNFVRRVNVTNATLVVHDWGGLIGLRVAAAMPERFVGIMVANSGLPTGEQKMPVSTRADRVGIANLNPNSCFCY